MEELDCSPNINDDDTTDDTTTTSFATISKSSSTTSTSFENDSSSSSSSSLSLRVTSSDDSDGDDSHFKIMQLPVEIRSKIFNMLHQRQVPSLRLVCRQWKEEVDQFYEFVLNVYDTTTNFRIIKELRCRECTIWKLTAKLEGSVFKHPAYLKAIKVYGPTTAENLSNLITASTNLEHLTLTRRANYPWFLNLKDTPALSSLQELKYLRLNSEEHVSLHVQKDSPTPPIPPLMDCYFPKLTHFEILKRFAVWQYSHFVTSILQFVARHSKTLKNIELDLIPLSCIALLDDSTDSDSSDSESAENRHGRYYKKKRRMSSISSDLIQLSELANLKLYKLCVTTKGSDADISIWKSILNQNQLRELRFDWICRDPLAEIHRARLAGFPWMHFVQPVEQSCETLVHVELANLSMFCPTDRVIPFDLGIFRNCKRLKSLILRCRENQAQLGINQNQVQEQQIAWPVEPGNIVVGDVVGFIGEGNNQALAQDHGQEVLLMINGGDLPVSLEQLEIFRFPMLTSEIGAMVQKLVNVRKLFLHECGKHGMFGVSADVIKLMASLTSLKFLEVIGFNDGGVEGGRQQLEFIFQSIGLPYEGRDTWLEFTDGSSSAHESLKVLL